MNLRLTLSFLLLALPGLAQTTLTNDGAVLTVTSGTTFYVAGTVQNNASGTLTNAGAVQLTGDLTNAGTLTSSGTLLFNGAADQTLVPGGATITSLTLSNTGPLGANRLLVAGNLTIGSALTLTRGLVRTLVGSTLSTLSLPAGGQVAGEGPGQYVQGRLAVTRASVSASTGSVDFTNSLVLNPNGQNLGSVTVTRTAGLRQAGVSYGTNVGGTAKGIDRVWQVVASQSPSSTAPVSATVSWVSDDDNGFSPSTPVQLWRADQASGPWAPQGVASSASARSFTANVTQLGVLTVSNTTAPLPVELIAFTAEPQGPNALLRWTTASERNNDRFEVEASLDGRTFQRIGQVAGHGNSAQSYAYQFVDPVISHYAANPVYYRLRQVDLDASFSYSPVRTVAVSRQPQLALFPNPTPRAATLMGAEPGAVVTVFDAVGRTVLTATIDGTGTAALALPAGSTTGVYVVRVGSQALRLTKE